MSRAPLRARSARVPLVVVMKTVQSLTALKVNSSGELPMSNPGIGIIFLSPASRTLLFSSFLESVIASSTSATGTTVRAPLARATAMDVEARSTSITATTRPCTSPGTSSPGDMNTSSFTLLRLLEELRLSLQELRVYIAGLKFGIGHDAREEWNRRRHTFDHERFERDLHSTHCFRSIAPLTYELRDQ